MQGRRYTKMRQHRRTALAFGYAAGAFLCCAALLFRITLHVDDLSLDIVGWFVEHGYARLCVAVVLTFGRGIAWLPAFGVALYVFVRCSRKTLGDALTRCGGCGYVLDGLGGLRCPECGKEI